MLRQPATIQLRQQPVQHPGAMLLRWQEWGVGVAAASALQIARQAGFPTRGGEPHSAHRAKAAGLTVGAQGRAAVDARPTPRLPGKAGFLGPLALPGLMLAHLAGQGAHVYRRGRRRGLLGHRDLRDSLAYRTSRTIRTVCWATRRLSAASAGDGRQRRMRR